MNQPGGGELLAQARHGSPLTKMNLMEHADRQMDWKMPCHAGEDTHGTA